MHQALSGHDELAILAGHTEWDFLAQVYIRTDDYPVSVAEAEGLV